MTAHLPPLEEATVSCAATSLRHSPCGSRGPLAPAPALKKGRKPGMLPKAPAAGLGCSPARAQVSAPHFTRTLGQAVAAADPDSSSVPVLHPHLEESQCLRRGYLTSHAPGQRSPAPPLRLRSSCCLYLNQGGALKELGTPAVQVKEALGRPFPSQARNVI